jgi:hypothetical protein
MDSAVAGLVGAGIGVLGLVFNSALGQRGQARMAREQRHQDRQERAYLELLVEVHRMEGGIGLILSDDPALAFSVTQLPPGATNEEMSRLLAITAAFCSQPMRDLVSAWHVGLQRFLKHARAATSAPSDHDEEMARFYRQGLWKLRHQMEDQARADLALDGPLQARSGLPWRRARRGPGPTSGTGSVR